MMPRDTLAKRVLRILAIYGIVVAGLVGFLHAIPDDPDPDKRAIVAMGLSLIVIWCILGGLAMRWARDGFVAQAKRLARLSLFERSKVKNLSKLGQ